jgi:hypothetical protein
MNRNTPLAEKCDLLHPIFGSFGIITLITFRTRGTERSFHPVFGSFGIITLITFLRVHPERSLILAHYYINNNYL